jgi:hypothetical protein
MIFSESATDIVHATAARFGWKDAVLVCDVGDTTIIVHYEAAGKTFVNSRCIDHTKFKTLDEALHPTAARHELRDDMILDITTIRGTSLRTFGKHGDELFFCRIAVRCAHTRSDAKPQAPR